MAFFLIGRGPDNGVRLLSSALFATRQDAMAELSRLSAEADFDFWDKDVFVADLDQSAPVLLVRPAGAPAAAEAEDAAADVWEADLPAAEQPVTSPADVEAVAAALDAGETQDDLRAALLRTTAFMAAEGIEAPASAGLSESDVASTVEAEREPEADATGHGEPEPESEPVADVEPEPDDEPERAAEASVVAEAASELEPADIAEPEASVDAQDEAEDLGAGSTVSDEAGAAGLTEVEPSGDSAPAAWPWDSLAADQVAEEAAPVDAADVYQALGTPGASIEEESDFILDLDAIAPIAYESPTEDTSTLHAEVDRTAADAEVAVPDLDTAQAADVYAKPLDTPGEATTALEIELEEYEVLEPLGVPAEETPGYAGYTPESPLTEYTCNDCVYVETCPNRDQRQPRDCGSFQWR